MVATDFSELGNAAIPFACGACAHGGLVKIVHVDRTGSRWSGRAATGHAARIRARLQSLIPNEILARCRPPAVAVLEGRDVPGAICREAENFGADLVCLASHGAGASRALHGSVARAVLKRIRRPLLVIRRLEE